MGKGIRRSLCKGDGSTSTLNPQKLLFSKPGPGKRISTHPFLTDGDVEDDDDSLELEDEEMAVRRAKLLRHYDYYMHSNINIINDVDRKKKQQQLQQQEGRRMSCVNNSDILRSARNAALNHYPRFSLDGKDAMYRSSFTSAHKPPNSTATAAAAATTTFSFIIPPPITASSTVLPSKPTREALVWRKPGVVAQLMGLDAMPVPLSILMKTHNLRSRVHHQRFHCNPNTFR